MQNIVPLNISRNNYQNVRTDCPPASNDSGYLTRKSVPHGPVSSDQFQDNLDRQVSSTQNAPYPTNLPDIFLS